jgi:hypothetical protein
MMILSTNFLVLRKFCLTTSCKFVKASLLEESPIWIKTGILDTQGLTVVTSYCNHLNCWETLKQVTPQYLIWRFEKTTWLGNQQQRPF